MIYYPDAPTIRLLTVPFSRLHYEGGGGLLRDHWFARFLLASLAEGFDPLRDPYANCARYAARLHSQDEEEIARISRAYLDERLCWFATYDVEAGMRDPLPVAIRADGRIDLLDGHHRAAMLYVRGKLAVTAAVKYVSPTWQRLVDDLHAVAQQDYLYSPIEHPWFDGWTLMRQHDWERERAILDAVQFLRGRIPANSWYDVGCCTGHLCRAAAARKWTAVGLEYQPLFVRTAEALNGFFGTACTYYQTDRFVDVIAGAEQRPGRSVGCVSILSVLHHWLREGNGDGHYTQALRTIAGNAWCFVVDADIPANGLVSGDKTGIPLGTDPEAYAAWLHNEIGCSLVRHVGTFDLGRPIFLASKVLS